MIKRKKKLKKNLKKNLNIAALEINIRKNMRFDSHGISDILENPRLYRKKRCFRKEDKYLSR
jgi:hypothetical protein